MTNDDRESGVGASFGRVGRKSGARGVVLALLPAAVLLAGCHREYGAWGGGGAGRVDAARVDRALDHLDVTDDRRDEVRVLALRLANELAAMRVEGMRVADEALAQWNATSPDAPALHAVLDRQLDEFRVRAHRVVDDALALHAQLDAGQREQVARFATRAPRWRH